MMFFPLTAFSSGNELASSPKKLPAPDITGKKPLEECIAKRRSVRKFQNKNLSVGQISQILWAGQGITDRKNGLRTAPSAGATYPMELYVLTPEGVFQYLQNDHSIEKVLSKDLRKQLSVAAFGQRYVSDAGISIVICAVYERTSFRYKDRGIRYVHMEAGHIAQNIHLEAEALGLGSVPLGAFDDNEVARLLGLEKECRPLYIIPVGYKAME